jgi:hypothetical protein
VVCPCFHSLFFPDRWPFRLSPTRLGVWLFSIAIAAFLALHALAWKKTMGIWLKKIKEK